MTQARITTCAGFWIGLISLLPPASEAYDLRTHAMLSERAFNTSAVSQQYLLDVGVSPTRALDLSSATDPDRLANIRNDGTPARLARRGRNPRRRLQY